MAGGRDPAGVGFEMSSYYARGTQALSAAGLSSDEKADVVIIGAGYTGLWTALECANRGLSAVVLEARSVGFGASGRNGGQAIPGWRQGVLDLIRTFGEERTRRLFALSEEARRSVLTLIAEEGIECDLRQGGHLLVAARPRDVEGLKREADALASFIGYGEARYLAAEEVRERVASARSFGGLLDMGGFQVHPLKFALGLARAALRRGARIFQDSPVQAIEATLNGVRIRTEGGDVLADHAVLACDALPGGPAPQLTSAVMPVAAYQIATEPLAEADQLIRGGLAVSDTRFAVNYYRISSDNRLIFGGGERYTVRPPANIERFVRPFLEEVFPQARDLRIEHAWGGLVSITRSRLPDVGRNGRCLHALGFSGQGVLLTALAGRAMAEDLIGRSERLREIAGLSPRRFPGGELLRSPLYCAGMLYHAARDRL